MSVDKLDKRGSQGISAADLGRKFNLEGGGREFKDPVQLNILTNPRFVDRYREGEFGADEADFTAAQKWYVTLDQSTEPQQQFVQKVLRSLDDNGFQTVANVRDESRDRRNFLRGIGIGVKVADFCQEAFKQENG